MLRSIAAVAGSARYPVAVFCVGLLAVGVLAWTGGRAFIKDGKAAQPSQTGSSPAARAARAASLVYTGTQAKGGQPVENPDPLAAQSAPAPASVHHVAAVTPASAGSLVAAGAPSDAEVRNELRAMSAAVAGARGASRIAADGTVTPRPNLPQTVAQVILGANAITDFPYVFGGGHSSFIDNAYDCSGSVSYALAAGGLVSAPKTSGDFESWGAPGPGRWITVYANAGHMYMVVDGVRYDTAGRTGVFSTRWQTGPDPGAGTNNAGMVVRHYPGL